MVSGAPCVVKQPRLEPECWASLVAESATGRPGGARKFRAAEATHAITPVPLVACPPVPLGVSGVRRCCTLRRRMIKPC